MQQQELAKPRDESLGKIMEAEDPIQLVKLVKKATKSFVLETQSIIVDKENIHWHHTGVGCLEAIFQYPCSPK